MEPTAAAWQRTDDGWARTVPLDPPVVFDGAGAGDALEAVVLPAAPGTLVVESKTGVERVAVESARRVVIPLAKGGRATARFEGGAASLHAARIVTGPGARPAQPRRVLLVVIDTLRDDAVSASSMPELIDAFAGGARFTRAYSPASWTLPAMASILTGRRPTELALPDGTLIALAPGESTIASDFAARGFYTAGVSANYTVNHENGFSAGCELFLVPSVLGHGDWPDADWVLERARRVLDWFPERDLFLYLHLMDPHDPYREAKTGESLPAPSTGQTVDTAIARRLRGAYADEARRTSERLAAFLREAGPFERVVVTADHGEEFLEHGGWRHGPTVYSEVSRVPLLIAGEGVEAGVVEDPVSLVDLRGYLTRQNLRAWSSDEVDVVSFVHAAPRFSWVHAEGQAILFAQDLAPPTVEDPIGEWLRSHHPALGFTDPGGSDRAPAPDEASNAALRLAARFQGLAAGQWLWVPRAVERLHLEIENASLGGWWWGAAKRVALSSAGAAGRVVLEVESPDPFALVFVSGAPSGRLSVAERETLDDVPAPPESPPLERAAAWRDQGRPAAALEGVDETMRRLRAQGYL